MSEDVKEIVARLRNATLVHFDYVSRCQAAETIERQAKRIAELDAENARLREALDNLQMYATSVVKGWTSIPDCEWENVYRALSQPQEGGE